MHAAYKCAIDIEKKKNTQLWVVPPKHLKTKYSGAKLKRTSSIWAKLSGKNEAYIS